MSWKFRAERNKIVDSNLRDVFLFKKGTAVDAEVTAPPSTTTTTTTTPAPTTTTITTTTAAPTTTSSTTLPCGAGVLQSYNYTLQLNEDDWLEGPYVDADSYAEVIVTGCGNWGVGDDKKANPEGWYCNHCDFTTTTQGGNFTQITEPDATSIPCLTGPYCRVTEAPSEVCLDPDHYIRDLRSRNVPTYAFVLAVRPRGSGPPGYSINDGIRTNRYAMLSPSDLGGSGGTLWMVFNDFLTDFGDNTGTFDVTINIYKQCSGDEPTTGPTTTTVTTTTTTTTTVPTTTAPATEPTIPTIGEPDL